MKKATLCYIRREGAAGHEYLMLYRNKKADDPNEGKWIGVGGKFEPGETPDECMLREVREETGLELSSYHFCGVIHFLSDTWEDEDMYLYRAEVGGGAAIKMPACEEGELQWVPEDQLMDLPMWEGDRLFLKPLLEGADTITMTLHYEGDDLVASEVG
ncbi:MAG: NUDIX hydrolase [Bacillota bacterium]